jgi:hypothetical protein
LSGYPRLEIRGLAYVSAPGAQLREGTQLEIRGIFGSFFFFCSVQTTT